MKDSTETTHTAGINLLIDFLKTIISVSVAMVAFTGVFLPESGIVSNSLPFLFLILSWGLLLLTVLLALLSVAAFSNLLRVPGKSSRKPILLANASFFGLFFSILLLISFAITSQKDPVRDRSVRAQNQAIEFLKGLPDVSTDGLKLHRFEKHNNAKYLLEYRSDSGLHILLLDAGDFEVLNYQIQRPAEE